MRSDMGRTLVRNEGREIAWLGLAVFLLPVALNLPSLFDWWLVDDPQVVLQAMKSSPMETLFSAEHYGSLSTANFTPLVVLSFDLDLYLFGPNPVAFHAHQILSFAVAMYLFFRLVSRFTRHHLAALAALGLAWSAAGGHAAEMLMLRHYVEGLLLALLALLFWESESTNDEWWSGHRVGLTATLAGGFYLLAMLGKEVFATLPVLFVAVSLVRREPWRRVLPRLVPSAAAAVAYVIWRWNMLGSFGGYAKSTGTMSWKRIWTLVAGTSEPFVFWGTLIGFLLYVLILTVSRFRSSVVVAVAVAVFLLLPLFPVLSMMEMRYLLIPLGVLMAMGGIASDAIYGSRIASMIVLIWVTLFAFGGHTYRESQSGWKQQMRAEGEYISTQPSHAPVLFAGSPEWYVDGLARMRRLSDGGASPGFLLSRTGLLVADLDTMEIVVASSDGSIDPLSEGAIANLRHEKNLLDGSLPQGVYFERNGTDVTWKLDPDCQCSWMFLSFPHYDETIVPPTGTRRLPIPEANRMFRIRVDELDGRWSISPLLRFPENGETTIWSK